jgi:hypothetical protein
MMRITVSTPKSRRQQARGRTLVRRLGLPEHALQRADAHAPDYWALASALDGVFTVAGGSLGQRHFLSVSHPELGGSTAAEAITEPGGVENVERLARAWTRKYRESPARASALLPHTDTSNDPWIDWSMEY